MGENLTYSVLSLAVEDLQFDFFQNVSTLLRILQLDIIEYKQYDF